MTHLLIRTECGPGPILYIARCGYRSERRKDFRVSGWAVTLEGVDCEMCLMGLHIGVVLPAMNL